MHETGFEAEFELGRRITQPPTWALEKRPPAEYLESRPGRLRLALTGGIASGKSSVARMFGELGAREIDFDRLAHRAMEPSQPAFAAALELFGPEAQGADGLLNRPFISQAVFSDSAKKAAWEAIVHPAVWQMMLEELAEMAGERAVVITVPLLFESGLESFFSPVALVFVSPALQLERLLARNPEMGREQALAIINAQWPVSAKLRASQVIINNNGSLNESFQQVRELWGHWC